MKSQAVIEATNDESWLLTEHTFWEVSSGGESIVYRPEDIAGELESRIECNHAYLTVQRVTMTGEAFERLNENCEEDEEDYHARMLDLEARLARIRERQEQAALPRLPGCDA